MSAASKDKNLTTQLTFGIQGIAQQGIANGGNADPTKTYFNPNQPAWVVGAQIGTKIRNLEFNFNYNYIFNAVRFFNAERMGQRAALYFYS